MADSAHTMPPEIFIGRKDELNKIMDPEGVNLIYGGRQLGKSAFSHVDLSKTVFTDCVFDGCRFDHCTLTGAKLDRCALRGVVFQSCDLGHVDMGTASLEGCTIQNSSLRSASVRQAVRCAFRSVDVTLADFAGVDFTTCTLDSLTMEGVYGANLWNRTARPRSTFRGSRILVRHIKQVYRFLEDVREVQVFDDGDPSLPADPLLVACEYRVCKNLPIPREALSALAARYWPEGIVVEKDLWPD